MTSDLTRIAERSSPGEPMETVVMSGGSAGALPPAAVSTDHNGAGVLPIGTRVAEFEVTALVGQGGFGAVYEAWDHTLERVVALKEYLPASLSIRQQSGAVVPLSERHRETFDLGMRSFINEARLLAQFDHPSLLKVYRFWEERGTTYLVMPFYRGPTLKQALAAQPAEIDEAWLLGVVDGVTQALEVMHASHCYHRDIAPDNIILLEGSGRPVLLDFGAARRVITDRTQAITVILKPGYAPVEQYAEMPDMQQGPWTDVYALAAVMHVALTGRTPPASVARMLSDSYRPLADNEALRVRYRPGLLAAIDAGLAVRPADRVQSVSELRSLLGLGDDATVIRPRTTVRAEGHQAEGRAVAPPADQAKDMPASTGRTSRDRRWSLLAGGAAVLALSGAAGWWLFLRNSGVSDAVATAAPPPPEATPAPVAPPVPPAPIPRAPRSPLASLQMLAEGTSPGFEVTAAPQRPEVTIGRDRLGFEVRSNRAGFVYVYLLSSGGELFMLFPNLLDRHNRIATGQPLVLPRAAWPMQSGGPAGVNHFAVLVSARERDFSDTGLQNDGVFPQFPLPVLAALDQGRPDGGTALRGRPVCDAGTQCDDAYGAALFQIVER